MAESKKGTDARSAEQSGKRSSELSLETYQEAAELRRLGNRAVRKAQAENRRRGIANVYSHEGRLYFELPGGEITEQDPLEKGANGRAT
ncbi:MAG: hypothetical protein AAGI71_15605 [Bacteroidota bacterium]